MILSIGDRVAAYEVQQVLGGGAAGEVYAVRDVGSGARFALKVLIDPTLVNSRRFQAEAGILTRLQHRNVVRCHGFLSVRGNPAMLLELASGEDLFTWLRGEGLTCAADERLGLLGGILRGVAAAHAEGIVHRDLKPANVLLVRWGTDLRPKVADFGLAKLLAPDELVGHLTRTNTALGTIGYMAPEQSLDAKRVDHRADLWSIGCIAYEVLSSSPAFPGEQWVQVLNNSMARRFAPLQGLEPDLPSQVVQTVEACLEPDPAHRPRDCGEVARGLGFDEELPAPRQAPPVAQTAPVGGPTRSVAMRTLPVDEE